MPTIEQITEGKVDYRIELRGGIVSIGRSPDNAIVLSNPGVARKHAQIVAEAGRWFLEDLNSRNGTFHNGLKVVGRSELSDGDSIGICDIRMVFWDSSRLSAPKEVSYITETERRTIETRTDPRADEDRIALERMTEKVEELNHQIDHMSRELNLAAEFLQASCTEKHRITRATASSAIIDSPSKSGEMRTTSSLCPTGGLSPALLTHAARA